MRKRLLITALLALACVPGWSAGGLPEKFDAQRDALADVQHAVTLARDQGKSVLVDVGGEWCTWCHIFDRFAASQAPVRETLRAHYILVKVNYSPQNRNERLLSQWPKARGYPHFYVLDAAGKLVASQPSGDLESGNGYSEEKVLAFLRGSLAGK